jgi:ATP-dependent RNA helicase DeaD
MELTRSTLRESLLTDDFEPFRSTLDALADEFPVEAVALAAIKFAHESTTTAIDDQEIPDVTVKAKNKTKTKDKDRNGGWERSGGKGDHKSGYKGKDGDKAAPRRVSASDSDPDVARLWVGVGRSGGVRPKDLVGAIANETRLSGKDIGAITITENFSIVEIPESAVEEVVSTMKRTTIKGKKTKVRRDRVGPDA